MHLTPDVWDYAAGFALPLLIAVVNRPGWPSWAKVGVALVTSAVAGVVKAWLTGHLDTTHAVDSFVYILGMAQTTYAMFWKPAKIAPAIEKATS